MSPGRESGASHALAADIGGTKTAVALAAADGRWPGIVEEAVYPSQDYASFEAVVTEFLARPACTPACAQHRSGVRLRGRPGGGRTCDDDQPALDH